MTFVNDLTIKNGAIFIADAHFKRGDRRLLSYFSGIPKGVQIFLMGDIFHLLIGSVKSSCDDNFELLSEIYKLSLRNEIIYLEGNHDFALKYALKDSKKVSNIRIFPYKMQPIIVRSYDEKVCVLAHGDIWISSFYDIYRKCVNNVLLLLCFKVIDRITFGKFYYKFRNRINRRNVKKFANFDIDSTNFMRERIMKYRTKIIDKILKVRKFDSYDTFFIIEGHFHLGESFECELVNLDSKNSSLNTNKTIKIHYTSLHSQYFYKQYFAFHNGTIS